jgi:multidrug resistance protein MdtO
MAHGSARHSKSTLFELLAVELAPRPGRWAAVSRITVACTLTVAIAMIFKIPQPPYMAYIVFLVTKDDRGGTLVAGLGGVVAITFAILLTLFFAQVDFAEPALRLPEIAVVTFAAMYSTRTFALGPLTYLSGFVTVLLHSLIDDVPNPEAFTHVALWLWVIFTVPVAITLMIHELFGHSVDVTLNRETRRVLEELAHALRQSSYRPRLAQWRRSIATLLDQAMHSKQAVAGPGHVGREALITILELLTLLEVTPLNERAVTACLAALNAILTSAETAPQEKEKHSLLVPDALSNPTHWQFALKTTLAVMICYASYTLLDWPGIRTAIVTCFFVALSSLGKTVHKLILRLSGAVIGGLAAGLCIVVVLPHMTDIGQLCALIAAASVAAGWVATSSELLAYAGLQFAFAFFLGILQDYAPATDLTVLRDRVIGILLGNIVITVIFSICWPESAKTALRTAVANAQRALATLSNEPDEASRALLVRELAKAEHLEAVGTLELRMLASRQAADEPLPAVADIERQAAAIFAASRESDSAADEARDLEQLSREVAHVALAVR